MNLLFANISKINKVKSPQRKAPAFRPVRDLLIISFFDVKASQIEEATSRKIAPRVLMKMPEADVPRKKTEEISSCVETKSIKETVERDTQKKHREDDCDDIIGSRLDQEHVQLTEDELIVFSIPNHFHAMLKEVFVFLRHMLKKVFDVDKLEYFFIDEDKQDADKKVDIDKQDEDGRTLLWWAAHRKLPKLVQVLATEARVDIPDKDGWTPLLLASINNNPDMVKALLDAGSDPNIKDKSGNQILEKIADNGHLKIMKLLLDNGADVNGKNQDGTTPLIRAAIFGHVEAAKLLLAQPGIDINVKNNDGQTAYMRAKANKETADHQEIARLIENHGK